MLQKIQRPVIRKIAQYNVPLNKIHKTITHRLAQRDLLLNKSWGYLFSH